MAEQNRNSYSNILKATALFGGVRVFQILINIIRAKLVALLIGPAGMGINNLLKSTLDTVNHITGCGLQTSAVRDVARSYEAGEKVRVDIVISSLRIIVWVTGIIGVLIVFFGSSFLSNFAFGDNSYSTEFKYLSIVMLATQLNTGQIALLQGTFHYKEIAKCTLIGNILSLILTIPIYYYYREKGIVPALIIATLITLFFSWLSSRKVEYHFIHLPFSVLWKEGKGMITLGFVIALGGLIGNLSAYMMNIYLSHMGTIQIVGLYAAATTIANSYIFMVMSAMSSDYVPRIAALSDDRQGQIEAINKQLILVVLILTPLIVAFIAFAKEAVFILYSSEFYDVVPMLQLFMVGMLFQAITWCLSYAIVARGDSKIFLLTEVYNFVISMLFKVLGYMLVGLVGIGIGFILDYIFEGWLIYIVCKKKFGFKFDYSFIKLTLVILTIILASIIAAMLLDGYIKYLMGSICFIVAIVFSTIELNKKTGMIVAIKKHLKK